MYVVEEIVCLQTRVTDGKRIIQNTYLFGERPQTSYPSDLRAYVCTTLTWIYPIGWETGSELFR